MQSNLLGYTVSGARYEGVLVYDEAAPGPLPAVLLAPDWMGVSAGAIASARQIAAARYVVFVVDMYGVGRRPADQEQAAAFAGPLKANAAEARCRAAGALESLVVEGARRGLTMPAQPAAVGYCFGGGNILELCRMGTDLSAAVSIHGDFSTNAPASPGTVKAPILVLHGSADPVAPEAQRRAFEAEMTAAGARWCMMVFGGVVHSFTDPGAAIEGIAKFDAAACDWTLAMIQRFLANAFKRPTSLA